MLIYVKILKASVHLDILYVDTETSAPHNLKIFFKISQELCYLEQK